LLGAGGSLSPSTLSAGSHTITAMVTDSGGRTASATRAVLVQGRPVVTITVPLDGTRIQLGTALTLTATATDAEEGNVSGRVTWTSSRDGVLGVGGTISISTLSAGTHT